jgi:hypothetical protein
MLTTNTRKLEKAGQKPMKSGRVIRCLDPRAQHRTRRTMAAAMSTVVILSILPWLHRPSNRWMGFTIDPRRTEDSS